MEPQSTEIKWLVSTFRQNGMRFRRPEKVQNSACGMRGAPVAANPAE